MLITGNHYHKHAEHSCPCPKTMLLHHFPSFFICPYPNHCVSLLSSLNIWPLSSILADRYLFSIRSGRIFCYQELFSLPFCMTPDQSDQAWITPHSTLSNPVSYRIPARKKADSRRSYCQPSQSACF